MLHMSRAKANNGSWSACHTLRYVVSASGKFGTKVRVNSRTRIHTHTHTVEWLLRENNNLLPRGVCVCVWGSVCVEIFTKLSINLIKIDGVCWEGADGMVACGREKLNV